MSPLQLHLIHELTVLLLGALTLGIVGHFILYKKSCLYQQLIAARTQSSRTRALAASAFLIVLSAGGIPGVLYLHVQHERSHGADDHLHVEDEEHPRSDRPAVTVARIAPARADVGSTSGPETLIPPSQVHVHEDGQVHQH